MRARQLALALFFVQPLFALKTADWKTCSQSAFCRRGRALAVRASESKDWISPYSVDASSITVSPQDASVTASVISSIYPDIKFTLDVQVLTDGVVRVRMDEKDGLRKRYNEAASWALIKEPEISKDIKWTVGKKDVRAEFDDVTAVIQLQPLKVSLLRKGKEEIVLNDGGLLHMEHFRTKEQEQPQIEAPPEGEEGAQAVLEQETETVNPAAWFEGEEDGWWEETFKSWKDSKPKGMSGHSTLAM